MLNCGTNDPDAGRRGVTRRAWLAHCSVLGLAGASLGLGLGAAPADAVEAAAPRRRILVVGDSLSAEYGLARGTGWVALLQARLAQKKIYAEVFNASISGDTTAGGRARLAPLLRQHRPTHVILELGGNDALRGLPLDATSANLAAMARAARAAGAKVMVVGMQVPPNYGRRYSDDFAALFAGVARSEGTTLVPFLLAGVADGPNPLAMFQPDRIHPTQAAHPRMLDNVWAVLEPMLR